MTRMQIIGVVCNFLATVALGLYVWKTWAIATATRKAADASRDALEEMRATREMEARPYVVVKPEVSSQGPVDLVVENVGRVPAYDVAFALPGPLEGVYAGKDNRVRDFLKDGVSYLPPGFEYRVYWGAGPELMRTGDETSGVPRTIATSYRDATSAKRYCETAPMVLHELQYLRLRHRKPLEEIAHNLSELSEAVSTITGTRSLDSA